MSAYKVDSGEENSPAAPAGIRTRYKLSRLAIQQLRTGQQRQDLDDLLIKVTDRSRHCRPATYVYTVLTQLLLQEGHDMANTYALDSDIPFEDTWRTSPLKTGPSADFPPDTWIHRK